MLIILVMRHRLTDHLFSFLIKTGPNENAMMYSQGTYKILGSQFFFGSFILISLLLVFTLMPDGQNSSNFFVLNDIFKLNLAMS